MGILEELLAEVKGLRADLAAGGGVTVSSGGTGGPAVTTTLVDSAPTPSTNVTAESLLALVQPLVQDEGTKAKVRAVLDKFGLGRLGEAQESQYGQLHAEFTAIANGGGAAAAEQSNDLI